MRKIYVTGKQVDKLMEILRKIPTSPVGHHLTDEQFIDYVGDTYSPRHIRRLDVHLASCEQCVSEIEHWVEAAEAWKGPEGEKRLDSLRQRIYQQYIREQQGDYTSRKK